MSVLVIGGTGFIGLRVIRLLAQRGEEIVCMDINPGAARFDDLGKQVRVLRGDVTQFDDVMAVTSESKPSRVLNLSYFLGDHPPHLATKLNIVGMDNCFEAARLCAINRVVYASSLAVSGQQKNFGDRPVTEEDYQYGDYQYAQHKRFNEFQAADYNRKYGMTITGVRPANVTGPDKVRGSVDHVNCVTQPARGKPISFPFADAMRCPIHVDDIAEVFSRVLMTDTSRSTASTIPAASRSAWAIWRRSCVAIYRMRRSRSRRKPAARRAPATTSSTTAAWSRSSVCNTAPIQSARVADHQRSARALEDCR